MQIKTNELTGAALDWAVAVAVGIKVFPSPYWGAITSGDCSPYQPSTDWSQGGPLIERRSIGFSYIGDEWLATADETSTGCGATESGPTHLIAAMRAIVLAELGNTVDVPEELV